MTKPEWMNFVRNNAQLLGKFSISAKQLWVLLSAQKQKQDQCDNPWLYLPIGMPDGLTVAEKDPEIDDLIERGLLKDKCIEGVKRQVCITEAGKKKLKEFFSEANLDCGVMNSGDGYGA